MDAKGLKGSCWCEAYVMGPDYPHRPTCTAASAQKIKIGYVAIKHGDPIKTASYSGSQQPKLYNKPGYALAVARKHGGIVCEAFIEVPRD